MEANRALLYCAGGGIGDSLVASIVGRALKRRFSSVDALTLRSHAAVLERVPDVDRVLVDEGDDRTMAERIAREGYAACVVTWATSRTAGIPWRSRIAIRVGQARRFYSYRFTQRVVVRTERGDVTSHWSDVLLDFARAIGCDTGDRRYRFVPNRRDEAESAELISGENFILLNPCNAIASRRRWPVDGWAMLATELRERYGAQILVSGSPSDAAVAEAIAERCGPDSGIVSIAGRTSVGAFGALARRARAFVGITTGSMHVAAAVGCPTVGIFPFQSDYPDRWAPLGERTAVVRASYPCHRGDTKERCRDYACIERLDRARIVAATDVLIA
ncbi:MAG TPA: glycosyltransferase family 9 protein [Candidatus Cybelea sp.]|nr:glycosyltransferase family 9 protein [Candidatus Cybelea sp.]